MKIISIVPVLLTIMMVAVLGGCVTTPTQEYDPFVSIQTNFALQNYKLAAQQLAPLADDGNPEAQYALGYLFYYGLGVDQDTDLARSLFRLAAQQDNSKAIRALTLLSDRESVFGTSSTTTYIDQIDLMEIDE